MLRHINGKLQKANEQIIKLCEELGLDFYETVFQIGNYEAISKVAAGDGFPVRYPHWKFGMSYNQLKNQSTYGWGTIYELVINTNPSYAYLLESNPDFIQKMVIAHVYGHVDFFKNNKWFSHTDRNMMNVMATHASKVKKYIDKYGQDKVESFLDVALSLENLIDANRAFDLNKKESEILPDLPPDISHFSKPVQSYINKTNIKESVESKEKDLLNKIKKPESDILLFLINNAPLKNWEADILSMVRDEAYYFLPQRQTKIMNEGWASYWHSKMMTEHVLDSSEMVDFANIHAGVMQMSPQNLNPYKLGIELFRDIEERWNKGHYGIDYHCCENLTERDNWDTKEMTGRDKIFQIRKSHNDITFIEEFLTDDFCKRNKMFMYYEEKQNFGYAVNKKTDEFNQIKTMLLKQLTNSGSPVIKALDSNHKNKGELLLKQYSDSHEELDMNKAKRVMHNLFKIWKRPIHMQTFNDKGDDQIITVIK